MHTESPPVENAYPLPPAGGTLCLWRGFPSASDPFPDECPCDRGCCLVQPRYWLSDPFDTPADRAFIAEVLDPVFRLLLGGAAGGEDGVG